MNIGENREQWIETITRYRAESMKEHDDIDERIAVCIAKIDQIEEHAAISMELLNLQTICLRRMHLASDKCWRLRIRVREYQMQVIKKNVERTDWHYSAKEREHLREGTTAVELELVEVFESNVSWYNGKQFQINRVLDRIKGYHDYYMTKNRQSRY